MQLEQQGLTADHDFSFRGTRVNNSILNYFDRFSEKIEELTQTHKNFRRTGQESANPVRAQERKRKREQWKIC